MPSINFKNKRQIYAQTLAKAFQKMYRASLDEWTTDQSLDEANKIAFKCLQRRLQMSKNDTIKPRVLDIGCGSGRHALMFAKENCAYVGVDLYAHRQWKQFEHTADVTFLKTHFPAQNELGNFDLVVDNGCFHHQSPDSFKEYLGAANQCLRSQGLLSLVVWAEPFTEHNRDNHGRLHHFFSDQELADLLIRHGFLLIERRHTLAKNGTKQLHGIFEKISEP